MFQTLTGEGATTPVLIARGLFAVMITGDFVATATLQRASYEKTRDAADLVDADFIDTDGSYNAPGNDTGENGSEAWFRFKIKSGDYTSGTFNGEISQ